MPRLTYYLLRQMTVAASMTAAGLTFAIWLSQSLRLLDIIVNRGLSIGLAVEFLMLLLPSLFALLLPIAVFIAVIFVYHRMNSDSELVVMRNAGVSDMGLARPAILFGCATMIITYGLTLYAIPASMRSYHDIQRDFAGNIAGVLIEAGVFTDLAPGVTFFAHARDRSGGLAGIIVNDSRDPARALIYTAERGAISSSSEGPRAVLENGTYQETNTKTAQVSVLYFDHTTVGLGNFFGHYTGPRRRTADELYLGELWSGSDAGNDLDARWRMRVEAHRRLVDPVYCLALALIAAACLVSSGQPRQGYNLQMLIATGCAGLLMIASFALRGVTEGTDALAPAVYALPMLAIGLALWPLTRNRLPSRSSAK
jgi:lipopolysaccharide export system permease protein